MECSVVKSVFGEMALGFHIRLQLIRYGYAAVSVAFIFGKCAGAVVRTILKIAGTQHNPRAEGGAALSCPARRRVRGRSRFGACDAARSGPAFSPASVNCRAKAVRKANIVKKKNFFSVTKLLHPTRTGRRHKEVFCTLRANVTVRLCMSLATLSLAVSLARRATTTRGAIKRFQNVQSL